MNEQRLIDFAQLYDSISDNWCGSEVAFVSDILNFIKDSTIINPENLPIVKELRDQLTKVMAERNEIATLCGKLIAICDQPRDIQKEVFRKYNLSMFGDYLGSGYPFVDTFNRIYDEFIETSSDGAYKLVKESAEKEFLSIQSKIKSSEVQKDE